MFMGKRGWFLSLILCFTVTPLAAKDIVLESALQSRNMIKNSTVWKPTDPSKLSPEDIFQGPKGMKKYEALLDRSKVNCVTNQEDQNRGFGGVTPKFYCQLLDENLDGVLKKSGKRRVIKVKYDQVDRPNYEIEGEILGTRLLWALGFYADRMYFVDRVNCYGCTSDPFKDRQVDMKAFEIPQTPRSFNDVAIEVKASGDKIISKFNVNGRDKLVEGVTLTRMVRWADNLEQLTHRDALRLLSIFMNHVDAKSENQRMVCKKENDKGECIKSIMMVQDIGSSFGVAVRKFKIKKTELNVWRNTPIWKNPKKCKAEFSKDPLPTLFIIANDGPQNDPRISERGRAFLADLLVKFSSNRERVVQLFKAARVDERGDSIDEWVNAFMDKVEQVRYPMGRSNPGFKCPQSRHEKRILRLSKRK